MRHRSWKGDLGDPKFLDSTSFFYDKTHGESPPDLYKMGCTYAFALYDEDRDGQVTFESYLACLATASYLLWTVLAL